MGPVRGSLLRWIYIFDIIQLDHSVNSKEQSCTGRRIHKSRYNEQVFHCDEREWIK